MLRGISLAACVSVLAALPGCVPDKPPPGSRPTAPQAKLGSTNRAAPVLPRQQVARPLQFPSAAPPSAASAAASGSAGPATPGPELDPLLTTPFTDHFERIEVGPSWTSTGGTWRIENGQLCVEHARNHPIWLRRKLPTNARVEFDALSTSPEGDLKAEFWGDGRSAADAISYTDATSYLTIFGGWKNHFHVLARINEHAPDRPEVRLDDQTDDPREKRVVPNRSYHFKVVRDDGHTVHWYVDDLPILSYPDPQPLLGPGHDHFGFNDWDVKACFDNLSVTPLPDTSAAR